jgi:hypothetical protein
MEELINGNEDQTVLMNALIVMWLLGRALLLVVGLDTGMVISHSDYID